MTERYTETINTLMGSIRLDDTLCSHILDIIPKLVEARAKCSLTAKPQGAIIEEETRKKDNWVKGDKGLFAGSVPTFDGGRMRITKSEYTRLCHQIATDYPLLPADGRMHFYENRNCIYQFTVLDFGSYNFSFKAPIEGNEEKIAVLRRSTHE